MVLIRAQSGRYSHRIDRSESVAELKDVLEKFPAVSAAETRAKRHVLDGVEWLRKLHVAFHNADHEGPSWSCCFA